MHAFQVPLSPGNILQRKEPYFELTPVAEIGFNYESEVCMSIGFLLYL
jgi:hypothetical protein